MLFEPIRPWSPVTVCHDSRPSHVVPCDGWVFGRWWPVAVSMPRAEDPRRGKHVSRSKTLVLFDHTCWSLGILMMSDYRSPYKLGIWNSSPMKKQPVSELSSLKLSCQICVRWPWKRLMFSVFYHLSICFVSQGAQISNIYIPASNASKEKWTRAVQDGPLPVLSGATGPPLNGLLNG